jgi:hypothetical protein
MGLFQPPALAPVILGNHVFGGEAELVEHAV